MQPLKWQELYLTTGNLVRKYLFKAVQCVSISHLFSLQKGGGRTTEGCYGGSSSLQ